jgi:hypothetical protein
MTPGLAGLIEFYLFIVLPTAFIFYIVLEGFFGGGIDE